MCGVWCALQCALSVSHFSPTVRTWSSHAATWSSHIFHPAPAARAQRGRGASARLVPRDQPPACSRMRKVHRSSRGGEQDGRWRRRKGSDEDGSVCSMYARRPASTPDDAGVPDEQRVGVIGCSSLTLDSLPGSGSSDDLRRYSESLSEVPSPSLPLLSWLAASLLPTRKVLTPQEGRGRRRGRRREGRQLFHLRKTARATSLSRSSLSPLRRQSGTTPQTPALCPAAPPSRRAQRRGFRALRAPRGRSARGDLPPPTRRRVGSARSAAAGCARAARRS